MYIFGIIMVIIGTLLYVGSKLLVRKTEKRVLKYKEADSKSDEEFLSLLNNSVVVSRIMGAIFIAAGAIFIFFL
jgi:hypothetical protein